MHGDSSWSLHSANQVHKPLGFRNRAVWWAEFSLRGATVRSKSAGKLRRNYLIDPIRAAGPRRKVVLHRRRCLSGISQVCFRILGIIRRWAALILAPLRCRSTAKALTWSYLVWILKPRVSQGVLGAVQTLAASGLSDADRDRPRSINSSRHNYTNNKYLSRPHPLTATLPSCCCSCCFSCSLRLIRAPIEEVRGLPANPRCRP